MTCGSEELCSGKDCMKSPTKLLKVKYIGKVGRFCQECSTDLFNAGLVEEGETNEGDRI